MFTPIYEMSAGRSYPDVSTILFMILENDPTLKWLSWISDASIGLGTQTRLWQFYEKTLEDQVTTLTASYTAPGPAVMTVADSSIFRIGDRITVDGHVDTNGLEIVYNVNSIPSGTTINVTAVRGTDANITAAGQIIRFTRGNPDNSAARTGKVLEPDIRSQYFQLFQEDVEVGLIAEATTRLGKILGFEETPALAQELERRMDLMRRQIWEAVYNGTPRPETSATAMAMMEGINTAINTSSGILGDAAGGPLTLALIDDAIQTMMERGCPMGQRLLFLAHPSNTRVLSEERTDKTTYTTNGPGESLGGSVEVFDSAINGYRVMVQADTRIRRHTAHIINLDAVGLVPSRMISTVADLVPTVTQVPASTWPIGQNTPNGVAWIDDSTTPGQLGVRRTLRADLSVKVLGRNSHHATIRDIVPA
jgi:hypothetical protein